MKRMNVVFLDRDGVINRDSSEYVKNWAEFAFLPGSLEALAQLTRHGFELIVITNQSIINRAMVPLAVLQETHRRMQEAVEQARGAGVDPPTAIFLISIIQTFPVLVVLVMIMRLIVIAFYRASDRQCLFWAASIKNGWV